MRTVLVMLFCLIGSSAMASESSKYEQIYLDCIDYSHQPPSTSEDKECRAKAKAEVLSTNEGYSQFLDCVDYYHGQVSEEREEACLKEIK